jgi:alginate O-acetyltransferase complex protein AlgI
MLGSISVDYAVALAIDRESRPKFRRMLLCLSLGYNLSVLGFFKYFNFSSENLQVVAHQIGWELHPITLSVVLPVGISFYTFQSPSYTLDVYAKRLRPTQNYLDYTTFVCFFPQLVAGPIERAGHLVAQFQSHRVFDYQLATDGCRQVLWGVFKKMVLADNLAKVVDPAFGAGLEGASGVSLAVATVFFAFQIYFDFSAYSDIAVGLAKWFGIDLRRNFAYPYFSASVPEFWRAGTFRCPVGFGTMCLCHWVEVAADVVGGHSIYCSPLSSVDSGMARHGTS